MKKQKQHYVAPEAMVVSMGHYNPLLTGSFNGSSQSDPGMGSGGAHMMDGDWNIE